MNDILYNIKESCPQDREPRWVPSCGAAPLLDVKDPMRTLYTIHNIETQGAVTVDLYWFNCLFFGKTREEILLKEWAGWILLSWLLTHAQT